jgi:hypothetical protein
VTLRQCALLRGIAARDAPARALVPARGLEMLARLLEVMGEERGVRRGRGSVDREQRSRDGGVRPTPAVQELCAVCHLVRERVPEGMLTRKPAGARSSAVTSRSSDAVSSAPGRSTTARSSSVGTSCPTTAAAWSTSLSRGASRSMRDARTAWTVSGSAISSTWAAGAYAPRSPRSAPRSTSERTISSTKRGLPWARASIRARSGASAGSGPSQSSSKVEASRGREAKGRDARPGRPSGPVLGPRGRDQQDLAARRFRSQEPAGEHLQRRVARRVEKVQVLDPEQHGLLSSASQDQIAE